MIVQAGVVLAVITAIAVILRECGVFESIRRRNLEKNWSKVKPQLLEKAQEKEKTYDHKWPEEQDD